MPLRHLALLFGLAALPVLAQSGGAADAYHRGARLYVDGELGPAEAAVRDGLRRAPDDRKLRDLLDLILQDQENQDGDQNQDPDGDTGDDGQQGEDGGQDGQPGEPGDQGDAPGQDGQNPDGAPDEPGETERDGTDQGRGETGQNDGADGQGARPGEGGDTPQGEAGAGAGPMSRAQAERLLDAVGGEEQLLLRELTRGRERIRRGDKDW